MSQYSLIAGRATAPRRRSTTVIALLIIATLLYAAFSLLQEWQQSGGNAALPWMLLALLTALAFEFVNGFHDTANAVATVIYTRSLSPTAAVIWSGICNFLGVLLSSGVVAFGIIALLPADMLHASASGNGMAMVFALLFSALSWNLATWYFGLPSSSSHALIGSVLGVGMANALLHHHSLAQGVDWQQAIKVGYALLLSPLVGFGCAALLLLVGKAVLRDRQLFQAPQGNQPPPFWIRGMLILTCSGVSFAHGSNDGQKGMGLMMLILATTLPVGMSMNAALSPEQNGQLAVQVQESQLQLSRVVPNQLLLGDPQSVLQRDTLDQQTLPALVGLLSRIAAELREFGSSADSPPDRALALRNAMLLASDTIGKLQRSTLVLPAETTHSLMQVKVEMDRASQAIPLWVKISVALALGLGTVVGFRRIVITVGERIGRQHLNYAQGASAELVAMATIGMADSAGLPVSTTHVLTSGVAGTMVANRSGLQMLTLRRLAVAWLLTLPVSILLAALLYLIFSGF